MTTATYNVEKHDLIKRVGKALTVSSVVAAAALLPELAAAGSTGLAGFQNVFQFFIDNINGSLGRVIVISMIIVGIVAGIVNQSLIAFAVGVGGGIGLINLDSVLTELMASTVVHADKVADATALMQGLTNGL